MSEMMVDVSLVPKQVSTFTPTTLAPRATPTSWNASNMGAMAVTVFIFPISNEVGTPGGMAIELLVCGQHACEGSKNEHE